MLGIKRTTPQTSPAKPVDNNPKKEVDVKVYREKLTHTYTCERCKLSYKFDPNDRRKCDCDQWVPGDPGLYGTYCASWRKRGRCCHHYEEIVKITCNDCNEEYDPRLVNHNFYCTMKKCMDCEKRAYVLSSHGVVVSTGVKITIHEGNAYCSSCLKDNLLITTLQNLTKALERLNGQG